MLRRLLLTTLVLLCLVLPLCAEDRHPRPSPADEVYTLLRRLAQLLAPETRTTTQTYYVAPGGSDTGGCTQSAPCKTIATAMAKMAGGDTLYLRAGTYAEHIGYPGKPFPPSGLSWDQPTTIAGYPGEKAVLKPVGVSAVLSFLSGFDQNKYHYLVFTNLVLDGSGVSDTTVYLGSNDYVKLTNSEICCNSHGTNISGSGSFNEFRNLYVHDASGYGWYWSGRDSLFEGNRVEDNGGYGMHIYSSEPQTYHVDRNTVRGNTFRGNGKNYVHSGTGQRQYVSAVIVASGSGHVVVNNLFVDNFSGIQVDYSGSQTAPHQVLNNTITGNQADAVIIGQATGTIVRNNIVYGNGSAITDRGTGTVQDHNLTTDPHFVSASDYHLAAGSPAIDAGVPLPGVTTDLEGTARPQGAGWDIGAYEFVGTTPPVPPQPPGGGALACSGQITTVPGPLALTCVPQAAR